MALHGSGEWHMRYFFLPSLWQPSWVFILPDLYWSCEATWCQWFPHSQWQATGFSKRPEV